MEAGNSTFDVFMKLSAARASKYEAIESHPRRRAPTLTQPRCAIGLLTWNGAADAGACARSVLAQDERGRDVGAPGGLEIIWIDNASTDDTVGALRRAAPAFPEPIRLEINTGFCAGHNLGIERSRAPYYLALNQDAVLAPDYVRLLCDWMDSDPALAMVSGLILETGGGEGSGFGGGDSLGELNDLADLAERVAGSESDPAVAAAAGVAWNALVRTARIYSAGLAMGRGRFPFELGMGRPVRATDFARRRVPGVTGAAMLLRREAVLAAAPRPGEVFPPEFFAYFEEVDLALRLAKAGLACGVHGGAVAWHAARGQGGVGRPDIRAHYFKNHWLMTLRDASLGELLRDASAILKTELMRFAPKYFREPAAALLGLARAARLAPRARADRRALAARWPDAAANRRAFFALSRAKLRKTDEPSD